MNQLQYADIKNRPGLVVHNSFQVNMFGATLTFDKLSGYGKYFYYVTRPGNGQGSGTYDTTQQEYTKALEIKEKQSNF